MITPLRVYAMQGSGEENCKDANNKTNKDQAASDTGTKFADDNFSRLF